MRRSSSLAGIAATPRSLPFSHSFSKGQWSLRRGIVVTHNLLEYRFINDVTGKLFSFICLVQHGECLWYYFGLSKWKPWKTFSRSYLQRTKVEKTQTKRVLENLIIPKLQVNSTTVAIVGHRYERHAVLQNVFAITLLWASEDVEENVYK